MDVDNVRERLKEFEIYIRDMSTILIRVTVIKVLTHSLTTILLVEGLSTQNLFRSNWLQEWQSVKIKQHPVVRGFTCNGLSKATRGLGDLRLNVLITKTKIRSPAETFPYEPCSIFLLLFLPHIWPYTKDGSIGCDTQTVRPKTKKQVNVIGFQK